MKPTLALLCLLLAALSLSSKAQVTDAALSLPPLTVYSSVTNMMLADSFSAVGDSLNASRYYLKIDPFFFVSSDKTPETIDSGFANYLLTVQAKEEYRKIFAKAYNAERTEAYKTFKVMWSEDQAIRNKLSRCRDSFSRSVFEQKMAQTDSPHFEYLYSYVKKNGWPTYENGSMFADVIALHDWKYMEYYLPFIKKSVIKGNSSPAFYNHIVNRARPSNLKTLLANKSKFSIDISYVLKGHKASPAQIEKIQKAVWDCGPIKGVCFVYESADKKDFSDFMKMGKDDNYWLAWDILVYVEDAQNKGISVRKDVPYDFLYSESISKQQKLTVYLLW